MSQDNLTSFYNYNFVHYRSNDLTSFSQVLCVLMSSSVS